MQRGTGRDTRGRQRQRNRVREHGYFILVLLFVLCLSPGVCACITMVSQPMTAWMLLKPGSGVLTSLESRDKEVFKVHGLEPSVIQTFLHM